MSNVRKALANLPFYSELRSAYRFMFKPEALSHAKRMQHFYKQFIPAGSTVFDVGANRGEYAEIFANCGGKVIAIEPNPAFKARLLALSRSASITPVFAAMGSSPGRAELNICSNPAFSTMSHADADWMKGSPDYVGVEWNKTVEVEVLTLADLARKYGTANYIKIDVEGFELEVLKGMGAKPEFISFEFGARRMEAAFHCMDCLIEQSFVAFRPMIGREYGFATGAWLNSDEAIAWLKTFTVETGEYGDMFVSLRPMPA
jgi:FkbM family methyltransferase